MKNSIVELLEAYPIPEQKEKPPYKIYCDMDGVLTDFESRFEHFTGKHPQAYEKEYGMEQFWHLIDFKIGVRLNKIYIIISNNTKMSFVIHHL